MFVMDGLSKAGSWHICNEVLSWPSSFQYIHLIFRESGSLSHALERLTQIAVGPHARLQADITGLMCGTSLPIMRPSFNGCLANSFAWLENFAAFLLPGVAT